MNINEDDYLAHYGTPRHSGRYPWGSGEAHETGHTRNKTLLENYSELKKQGMKDTDVCRALGIGNTDKHGNFHPSTTQLRAKLSMERAAKKEAEVSQALKLKDKGMANTAAARQMGVGEGYFRTLIAEGAADKARQLTSISDKLQSELDAPGDHLAIDVGAGVENHLGIPKTRLDVSLAMLKEKGYSVYQVPVPQATTRFDTNTRVLAKPGVPQSEIWKNQDKIKQLTVVTGDRGRPESWGRNDYPPLSIHPDRVKIKYGDEGGSEKDGVIYVRPNVKDISLGKSRYAQVRIKVGDGHYLKGMAMYHDDLPAGTDLLFHTNKPKVDPDTGKINGKLDVMKPLEADPSLPFGSVIRRQIKDNENTPNEKLSSAMNILSEEGNWKDWGRNISSQALSKQNPVLARTQLGKTYDSRKAEYDEIMSYTNPAVRRKLLETFADATDKSAVHLKAASLDRQNWHVILPIESMKPTEVYAPKYNNGERVVLIRYPHGGKFEIPELVVNNRQPEANRLIKGAEDAIGIHHSVAQRLSGADFDGDTVLVIPNNRDTIKSTSALDELKDFDPKRLYKLPEGVKFSGNKQMLMGMTSNLITDMTLRGAPNKDIALAVKHSMVVIDAEKHDLDVRRSFQDQKIKVLQERYQAKLDPTKQAGGASTIISKARSKEFIPDRKPRPYKEGGPINKETGELEWVPSGKTRKGPNGTRIPIKIKTTKLAEARDAHSLVSDANTPMERIYADHSNRLKALANQARLSKINTPTLKTSSSAKKAYAPEVQSLLASLDVARKNSPLERQANIVATQAINARKAANPDLKGDTLNKIRYQEMAKARDRLGATKEPIYIKDKEWDAIQAGAISNDKLEQILNNADLDRVRQLATPRPERLMTKAKVSQAQILLDQGYTKAEVARRLGVSVSTLDLHTSADDQEDSHP